MRNDSSVRTIFSLVKNLPYFRIDDLRGTAKNETYLKIALSRYSKKERVIRLKKGVYVSVDFTNKIQKEGNFSPYLEFLANVLYFPSYLSLEYILYENNILTEIPKNFTSIALNKTKRFSNKFGNFTYHKIKRNLFFGFKVFRGADFYIYKATKPKALFDFLYLRKNLIVDKRSIEELRLNIGNFTKEDKMEFKKYIEIEDSRKMKNILNMVFNP